jgi:hypothetical protein
MVGALPSLCVASPRGAKQPRGGTPRELVSSKWGPTTNCTRTPSLPAAFGGAVQLVTLASTLPMDGPGHVSSGSLQGMRVGVVTSPTSELTNAQVQVAQVSAPPHHSTSTNIISFPAISIDGGVHTAASTIVPSTEPAAPPAPATPLALPAAPVAAMPPALPMLVVVPPHAGSIASTPIKRSGGTRAILVRPTILAFSGGRERERSDRRVRPTATPGWAAWSL